MIKQENGKKKKERTTNTLTEPLDSRLWTLYPEVLQKSSPILPKELRLRGKDLNDISRDGAYTSTR